jgi:exonuclease VII large subunit
MDIDNKSLKDCEFKCNFCNASFSSKKTLTFHIKSNKKCIVNRPVLNISCIWCNTTFLTKDDLVKHHKICVVDKETIYAITLEQNKQLQEKINTLEEHIEEKIEKQIKEKEEQIKDLQEKLYNLANKSTTTNNTTYNVTLNCDKPLLLAKERVSSLMVQHCNISYLKNGGKGIAQWFLKYVCVNDKGNICLECTDKRRKTFKYIDVNDKLVTKSGEELADIVDSCKEDFKKCSHFKEYEKEYFDKQYENMNYMVNFFGFQKTFINHLAKVTCTDNIKYIEPIQQVSM